MTRYDYWCSFCSLGTAALALLLLTAWTDTKPFYIGADESTPANESALVVWTTSRLAATTPAFYLQRIVPASVDRYSSPQLYPSFDRFSRVPYVVLKGDRYLVSGYCVLVARDAYAEIEYDFEGGKRYRIECSGRTPRSVKLVVTEV